MQRALRRRQKGQGYVEYGIIVAVLAVVGAVSLSVLAQAQRAYFQGLPGIAATPTPQPTATPVPGFHLAQAMTTCSINSIPAHTGHVGDTAKCQTVVTDQTGKVVPSSGTLTWTVSPNPVSPTPPTYTSPPCDLGSTCGPNPVPLGAFTLNSKGSYLVTATLGPGTLPAGWVIGYEGPWLIVVN
jgi:hypothetical protein